MFFEYDITYPPNTSPDNERVDVLRLTRGIVKRVELVFPRGVCALTGVRIFRGNVQVIPLNYPSWVETDGEVVRIDTNIDLTVNPYELEVRGYNIDDTYPHTIRMRFLLELPEERFSMTLPQRESELLVSQLES
jgi:hypothetical protein